MVLENMVAAETVEHDISDVDKWTVNERLVDLIFESRKSADREGQGSTGLENGIALPHARTDGIDDFVCAIGISRSGIDFDSADGKPCHIIFLVVGPRQESTRYLNALSTIAYIGNNKDKVSELISASSPEEVISIL